jgi:hypothetical protein
MNPLRGKTMADSVDRVFAKAVDVSAEEEAAAIAELTEDVCYWFEDITRAVSSPADELHFRKAAEICYHGHYNPYNFVRVNLGEGKLNRAAAFLHGVSCEAKYLEWNGPQNFNLLLECARRVVRDLLANDEKILLRHRQKNPEMTGEEVLLTAAEETSILKAKINTAARTSFQALKILHAKKLCYSGVGEEQSLAAFYEITDSYGFSKRTVQRRVQTANAMIDKYLITTNLVSRIEQAKTLDAELLAEIEMNIETKVGSTSFTELMVWLGVLEKSDKDEHVENAEASALDERVSKKLDSTYKVLGEIVYLRLSMMKEGLPIEGELADVFKALEHALVILGSYSAFYAVG